MATDIQSNKPFSDTAVKGTDPPIEARAKCSGTLFEVGDRFAIGAGESWVVAESPRGRTNSDAYTAQARLLFVSFLTTFVLSSAGSRRRAVSRREQTGGARVAQ